jgi:hypothetical protein
MNAQNVSMARTSFVPSPTVFRIAQAQSAIDAATGPRNGNLIDTGNLRWSLSAKCVEQTTAQLFPREPHEEQSEFDDVDREQEQQAVASIKALNSVALTNLFPTHFYRE